jgi:hypothetical protein
MLTGRKLALTLAFTVLVAVAFGVSCKGFFVPPTLTSITINPTAPSVQFGQTTTVQAYVVNSNDQGSYATSGVSWSSSDDTIATVTGTGSATLTGVSAGTVQITAASENVTNTATATVYITISSMSITPTSASIAPGQTQSFQVFANGGADNITSGATLTAYQNGTQVTSISCAYNSADSKQDCTTTSATAGGTYQVVASYTGSTFTATATLNIT